MASKKKNQTEINNDISSITKKGQIVNSAGNNIKNRYDSRTRG